MPINTYITQTLFVWVHWWILTLSPCHINLQNLLHLYYNIHIISKKNLEFHQKDFHIVDEPLNYFNLFTSFQVEVFRRNSTLARDHKKFRIKDFLSTVFGICELWWPHNFLISINVQSWWNWILGKIVLKVFLNIFWYIPSNYI